MKPITTTTTTSSSSLLLLIIALTAKSAATLLPPQPTYLNSTNVLICIGENYQYGCTIFVVPLNITNAKCQHLAPPYFHNVGSFKPSVGSFCRITYTRDSCTAHGDAFVNPTPGAPTMHTNFTDPADGENVDVGSMMSSFLCQECLNCT
ncbi:hypothetical protein EJ02DRAFT_488350 [Clathrospora elynae]|uniref:Uncharacterized protein n=1 Tax=Clathrospora elynae TaxID=706981 RepID=A0A6A5ST02_9PLEO|nr:hypothetical protein EJ02DRAFT_488350 [Clathrospora elynae]